MKKPFKPTPGAQLRQRTQEEFEEAQHLHSAAGPHEFQTPEEMLRLDATGTEVPPQIEERLAESIRKETEGDPPPAGGWLAKLFL